MGKIKVGMISLGCSKNQVDAELMMGQISTHGLELCNDLEQCQAVVVNTCGFIEAAKAESIETILELCQQKGEGALRCVLVTGCLAERYREELIEEIPEADGVVGIGSNSEIVSAIHRVLAGERVAEFGAKADLSMEGTRLLANAPHFAYLKVAEGCGHQCTFCAIPGIRGDFRSRPMENILEEARLLARQGVQELNLVAQDTTRYGLDLYGQYRLPQLLDEICAIPEVKWVRILYCYPSSITDELIASIARNHKIVKYIDIPFQHASGKVLREMRRPGNREEILEMCRYLREKIPGVILRTTFIAGFPGETQEDFEELCQVVEEVRFERLGCFAYSQEEGTPAGEREDQIDPEVRQRRAEIIMERQMDIAFAFAKSCIGRTLEVLVEGQEGSRWYGRSYMDAPDIDTKVFFNSHSEHKPGELVPVVIRESKEYDLVGDVL